MPAVDPRRAGMTGQMPAFDPRRSSPAAPPAAGGRASRRDRRGAGPETRKKNNTPLILGVAGGGVVVVIILIVVFAMGGKKRPGVTPVAGGGGASMAGGGGVAPPPPTAADKQRQLEKDWLAAGKDLTRLESLYRDAKSQGFSEQCRKIARDVVDKVDKNAVWANEELGRKDLKPLFAKIPEDEKLEKCPNDEFEKLRFMADDTEESTWVDAERYAEVEKMLQTTLDHLAKLKSDPLYEDTCNVLMRVKRDPIMRDFHTRASDVHTPPYVVIAETGDRVDLAANLEADKLVKRNVDLLQQLYQTFLEKFGSSFGLEPLSTQQTGDMRTLKVLTFFNEENFKKYQQAIGMPLPDGVRAYYSPVSQWIILYEGRGYEEAGGKDASSFNVNKTIHEGVHQLIHAFTKATVEKALGGESLPWTDVRLHSRLHWFQEGMAELFGSSKPKDGGGVEMMVPYRSRLGEWKMTRNQKLSEWTFEELMDVSTGQDMQQKAQRKGLADAGRLSSLFYAQAWAWCHFLYFHENGKYRQLLLDQLKLELNGESGPAVFKEKVWKTKPGDAAFTAMKEEFEKYVQKLWTDMGIK
jgi:hypothetical protein